MKNPPAYDVPAGWLMIFLSGGSKWTVTAAHAIKEKNERVRFHEAFLLGHTLQAGMIYACPCVAQTRLTLPRGHV